MYQCFKTFGIIVKFSIFKVYFDWSISITVFFFFTDKPIDGGEEMMEIDEIVEEEEYDEDTNQIEALEELEDLVCTF